MLCHLIIASILVFLPFASMLGSYALLAIESCCHCDRFASQIINFCHISGFQLCTPQVLLCILYTSYMSIYLKMREPLFDDFYLSADECLL